MSKDKISSVQCTYLRSKRLTPGFSSFWMTLVGSKEKKEVRLEQDVTFLAGSEVRFATGLGV